jgi:hypothetical protein
MTRRAMTSGVRTKIIEELKTNRNAAAAARQFGFGETTILTLCKKEGIELKHLLTKAKYAEVVKLLTTNSNGLATAKQLGINHKTVLAVAKKEGIDIKARRQAAKGRKTPPFMQWARGPRGEPVLQCAVYLSDGSRLCPSLNTADTEAEGPQRMRLLLWHAIFKRQLPGGAQHAAWGWYGGSIPQAIKSFLRRLAGLPFEKYELKRTLAAERLGLHASTIDWLTNQNEAREADPARRARARILKRSRARRDGKLTPISKSWQFGRLGRMLAVHAGGYPVYAQLTIAGFTLRWRLQVENRAAGEALVRPALDARARVSEAAIHWRECTVGSPEATTALATLLAKQRLFRDALVRLGAKGSKGWADASKALEEPPLVEEARGRHLATYWFVDLLRKNPERPPPGRSVRMLLEQANALFGVGGRGARYCYELAQQKTGNTNWSTSRRPRKSAP